MPFSEILKLSFYNNTVRTWLTAAAVALTTLIILWVFQRYVLKQIGRFTNATRIKTDNFLTQAFQQTKFIILVLLSLYAGSLVLSLPTQVDQWVGAIAIIIFLIQVGIWANEFVNAWVDDFRDTNLEDHAAQVTTMRALGFVAKFVIFSIVVLIALDNIPGVEITTLIASLGIGGVAVALAVQNILGDLFASLSISLDKPFVIGDFITVDDYAGQVEQVGLKTTRLRSISGEQLIFSNSDLLNSRVRNYKRMAERRVVFSFGVVYSTPAAQLEEIPHMVQEIIEQQENARFDRAHFKSFGASSLDYEVVFYVLSNDYTMYMTIQQAINLALYRLFEEQGIEFAFPTRTLYVNQVEQGRQEKETSHD